MCKIFILAIFPFIAIFHHTDVTLIARCTDVVIFNFFQHCTAGFVHVCAICKFTFRRGSKNFFEIVTHFCFFHINCTKAFYPRSVDNMAT